MSLVCEHLFVTRWKYYVLWLTYNLHFFLNIHNIICIIKTALIMYKPPEVFRHIIWGKNTLVYSYKLRFVIGFDGSMTFIIHRTFPLHKRWKGDFMNCSLKGSLGNQKWLCYGIFCRSTLKTFILKCISMTMSTLSTFASWEYRDFRGWIKGIVHSKVFHSSCSKPVWVYFFHWTQKDILKNVGMQTVTGIHWLP